MRSTRVDDFPAAARTHAEVLHGRSMLVRKTEPFPIECVARGYLSGSGWKEYQQTGSVCGVKLPAGLRESDRLPEPIFTPATKAATGHDINISEDEAGQHRRARHDREAAQHDAAALLARRRARRAPRHHRRRHEVRVRPRDRRPEQGRDHPHRRGADARLVALLAARHLHPGRPAAELRQAVRARLSGIDPLEQAAAGADACPTTSSRRRARSTSRRSVC